MPYQGLRGYNARQITQVRVFAVFFDVFHMSVHKLPERWANARAFMLLLRCKRLAPHLTDNWLEVRTRRGSDIRL